MKTLEEIGALVDDRMTLLNGLNDVVELASNDYSISRKAIERIHDVLITTLKNLKYEQTHAIAQVGHGRD